jgi:hypothetical protein
MADAPVIRAGEIPPEYVAYLLMQDVRHGEKPTVTEADYRAYILDLYVECLDAVVGQRESTSKPG